MRIVVQCLTALSLAALLGCGEGPQSATGETEGGVPAGVVLSCGSASAASDRVHFKKDSKVCMAIYAWPTDGANSTKPTEDVDRCWKGAHITMAGFEEYRAGYEQTMSSSHLADLMAKSAHASKSSDRWYVKKAVLKTERPPENSPGSAGVRCPNGPEQNGRDCYLRFDENPDQRESASLALVNQSLRDQKFKGVKSMYQGRNGEMGLHLTVDHKKCHSGSACYKKLAEDMWESGSNRTPFLLGPVVIDLSKTPLNNCREIKSSDCPTEKWGSEALRFCHNLAPNHIHSK